MPQCTHFRLPPLRSLRSLTALSHAVFSQSEATLNQFRGGDGVVENKCRLASLSEMSEEVDRCVTISRRSSGGRSVRPGLSIVMFEAFSRLILALQSEVFEAKQTECESNRSKLKKDLHTGVACALDQMKDRCQMLASLRSCLNKQFASTPSP